MSMRSKGRGALLAAGLLVLGLLAGCHEAQAASAADLLYGGDDLATVSAGAVLRYAHVYEGSWVEEPRHDSLSISFAPAEDGVGYAATAEIVEAARSLAVGPIAARRNNPLLLLFFQHDSILTTRRLGGGQRYLKRLLRDALNRADVATQATEVPFAGGRVRATRVILTPYRDAAEAAQLGPLANKQFRFTLADAVPGRLYEVETVTVAAEGGEILARESYRYVETD